MRKKIAFFIKRIKEGRLKEMWKQSKWIYNYARHYWPQMLFYTALGFTGTLVSLGSGFASRDLINIITNQQSGELITTFCVMIGLNVGNLVVSQISSYASNWISMKVSAEIKQDVFEKILVTDWESLTTYHTGDLLTRWGGDVSMISSGVLNYIPNLIINIFRFISAFIVVLYHDASFALFAFLGMPVSIIMSKTIMKRMVNNNKRSAEMNAKISGFNQEAFSNIQTIKAFDLIRVYVQKLRNLQKESINMNLEFQKMSMGTSFILSAVGLLVSYSSYGWGIYRVFSGAIDYGTMTMFLGLSSTLTGTLHSITGMIPMAINITTSAGRVMDIVEMPREDYSGSEKVSEFFDKYKDNGISLELQDIRYAYKTGTLVFDKASIMAHPHEIVALVGPSGEGKTTMLRLLLSLMPIQDGQAVVTAGEEKIPIDPSVRKLFSYVPQGNTMFSGTIAENMRIVKEDVTDEEIIDALKLACAWDFVENLPDGINSAIKERGGGFSEGQAQRLSIARALLRKSPILLLDEATSALDVATERKVLKNIMNDEYPRTCIVTTHRPTVLNTCTRVYCIKDKKCIVMNDEEISEMINNF